MPTLNDIEEAYHRIQRMINKTNVLTSRTLNSLVGAQVFLKCENFQRVGAFKFRGVSNKLLQLSPKEKKKGIIAHSSGNHAQAVALASSILNIPAVIVMPKGASKVKMEATKHYGATIVTCENTLAAREETCQQLIDAHGYTLIHPYGTSTRNMLRY